GHGVDFFNGQILDAGGNDTGVVSLRSAVQAANINPFNNPNAVNSVNSINLAQAGTIHLTPGTPGESDNLAGELVIKAGANALIIANSSGGAVTVDAGGAN